MAEQGKIATVAGTISGNSGGICQFHEHILLRRGVPAQLNPALCADSVEKSGEELSAFRKAGGEMVVDAQPIGCGRMPAELELLAQKTGVHIVASTGFHVARFYPSDHWLFRLREWELEDLFCLELTQALYQNADRSLDGHKIPRRAGVVKTACEAGPLSSRQKRLFTAAAYAARSCGAPMMIHTDPGSDPLALFQFLTALGLPPERQVFCHLDRTCPEETALRLCRAGAYVEQDTIGRSQYHSDEEEVRLICALLEAGCEDRLLLSLDTTSRRMQAYGGSIGLTYLLEKFLPRLRRAGVGERAIHKMTASNAARILTGGA